MKIIGLTGGTGSGKGFVSDRLRQRSAYVIDTDAIAHEIIEKGKPAYNEIVEYFGNGILDENGEIIRRKLGSIVFTNKEKLAFLNVCTHKYISEEILKIIDKVKAQTDKYSAVVIDAPLLAEAGLVDICDDVWVVYADSSVRKKRIMERDCISEEQAKDRIASQKTWEEYKNLGAVIINNSSDDENVERQLDELM
ncbi:MAG: dephospho-CoA kinase [Candidatus Metalachnospira sp.]|nr:dephospho-CoA kinase [Candidatus Metalachnospira sp.]